MNTSLKEYLADTYLDWLNNYLTVGRFAEDHGMEAEDALVLIRLGRRMQEERATGEFPEAPQPAIPPGYKLVPVEPTEAMLGAGLRHIDGMASMPSAYRAMLNAAPEAPQPAKRVPLTDEEIIEMHTATTGWLGCPSGIFNFARAIERAHGITGEPT